MRVVIHNIVFVSVIDHHVKSNSVHTIKLHRAHKRKQQLFLYSTELFISEGICGKLKLLVNIRESI